MNQENLAKAEEIANRIKKAFQTTPDDNSYISHSMMSGALQVTKKVVAQALQEAKAEVAREALTIKRPKEMRRWTTCRGYDAAKLHVKEKMHKYLNQEPT